jgi:hypothetical protein
LGKPTIPSLRGNLADDIGGWRSGGGAEKREGVFKKGRQSKDERKMGLEKGKMYAEGAATKGKKYA